MVAKCLCLLKFSFKNYFRIKNTDVIESLIVSQEFSNVLHLRSCSLYNGFALLSPKSCRKLLGTWNSSANIDLINPTGIKKHCYQTCVGYSYVEIQKNIIVLLFDSSQFLKIEGEEHGRKAFFLFSFKCIYIHVGQK